MKAALLERLQHLDPAAPGSTIPAEVMDASELLDELATRSLRPDSGNRRRNSWRWMKPMLAAFIATMLLGGIAWLARVIETAAPSGPVEATVTTTVPVTPVDSPLTTLGLPVAPGQWSLGVRVPGGSDDARTLALEIITWPGVVGVATAAEEADWVEHTGTSASCPESTCGHGVVVLTDGGYTGLIRHRLIDQYGVSVVAATEVATDFFAGYIAHVRDSPSPLLDAVPVGVQVPLTLESADTGISVASEWEGTRAIATLTLGGSDLVVLEAETVDFGGSGGIGVPLDMLTGHGQTSPVVGDLSMHTDYLGPGTSRRMYVLAGLPAEAAAVTMKLHDGTSVWQTPIGGIVLIVDRPGSVPDNYIVFHDDGGTPEGDFVEQLPDVGPIAVLDPSGNEIIRITQSSPGGPKAVDLRLEPLDDPDFSQPGPTLEVGDAAMEWALVQSPVQDGPVELVPIDAGLLRLERGTDRVSLSGDGRMWSEAPAVPGLGRINWVAHSNGIVLVSGIDKDSRQRLWRTTDGMSWTVIDLAPLGAGSFDVESTTPGGLTMFRSDDRRVMAEVASDSMGPVESLPDLLSCCGRESRVSLYELESGLVAIQSSDLAMRRAWRYLGDGEWATPVEIPASTNQVLVRGSLYAFDHHDFEVGRPPRNEPSSATLLTSTDGINWTEEITVPTEHGNGLQIAGGDGMLVYGLHGYGGNHIELYGDFATLMVSTDGKTWHSLDMTFAEDHAIVEVAGRTIFVYPASAPGSDSLWVGVLIL